ncbi:MAG TPA: class I SAM-dependent methyltransferase [Verrucomicrobiae bacterium]|nr:class I SAM-dependent methyltransferase [Verrucomicrobiae bacterium]
MPRTLSPEETYDLIIDQVERLESLPTFGEPTAEDYALYQQMQLRDKAYAHQLNRGKRQIALELNMNMSEFEAQFIGKTILDVGCGVGMLSNELSRLKKTQVTALDSDPEVLNHVKEGKNIRAVQGSGYDLPAAVGDERFDVVIVSYSSLFWAGDGKEKRAAITSPLAATAVGGQSIFIPVIADIGARDRNRRILEIYGDAEDRQGGDVKAEVIEAAVRVGDWLDVLAVTTLLDQEEAGAIESTFVSSRENARQIPLIRNLPPGEASPVLERYSALATVLE